jgi:hypothetical protein
MGLLEQHTRRLINEWMYVWLTFKDGISRWLRDMIRAARMFGNKPMPSLGGFTRAD